MWITIRLAKNLIRIKGLKEVYDAKSVIELTTCG